MTTTDETAAGLRVEVDRLTAEAEKRSSEARIIFGAINLANTTLTRDLSECEMQRDAAVAALTRVRAAHGVIQDALSYWKNLGYEGYSVDATTEIEAILAAALDGAP